MAKWLIKSEPNSYSWDDLVRDDGTEWDGVRNFVAQANLQKMKMGDQAFYYHSGTKEVVGIAEVTKEAYPDPTDPEGDSVMVDVKPVKPFPRPVSLAEVKADKRFQDLELVRLSRLSVQHVPDDAWQQICKMGGL
jgi:predicted RNA-binding protein with PUA-like domain